MHQLTNAGPNPMQKYKKLPASNLKQLKVPTNSADDVPLTFLIDSAITGALFWFRAPVKHQQGTTNFAQVGLTATCRSCAVSRGLMEPGASPCESFPLAQTKTCPYLKCVKLWDLPTNPRPCRDWNIYGYLHGWGMLHLVLCSVCPD